MSRMYTVPYQGTLTNAGGTADLFELTPGDDKPIRLRGLVLGQTSEVADAAEESIRISIMHLGATVTSGDGTSVTPVPLDLSNAAAGFAAEGNGAAVATSSGTTTIVEESAWNLRLSPLERWWPDGDFAPMARQGAAIVVRCQTTVADDVSIAITAYVEEM